MKKMRVLLLLSAMLATTCGRVWAGEYRLMVLIDAAGLDRGDCYQKVYGAVTTEWPIQEYRLDGDDVRVSARLFGIEIYTVSADQLRDTPLSAGGKVVDNLAEKVKDCAEGSLIDTTVVKHQRLRDQFREELMEGGWLRNNDGVVLLSFSPSLQNFKNRLPAELQAKLSIIGLTGSGEFFLNTKALSDGLKVAHSAFQAEVGKDQERRKALAEQEERRKQEADALKVKVATADATLAAKDAEIDKMVADGKANGKALEEYRLEVQALSKRLDDAAAAAEKAAKEAESARENARVIEARLKNATEMEKSALQAELDKAKREEAVAAQAAKNAQGEAAAAKQACDKLAKADTSVEPVVNAEGTQPDASDSGVNVLIVLLVLGGVGFAAWRLWPRKKWTVTIEREGVPDAELIVVGKAAKPFSSAGDVGTVGSLQIRYLRQSDIDTGEQKDVFQLKAPVEGWSVNTGASKTVLPPGEWSAALDANTRYAVYTDAYAETPSVRFTVEERA